MCFLASPDKTMQNNLEITSKCHCGTRNLTFSGKTAIWGPSEPSSPYCKPAEKISEITPFISYSEN